MLLVPHFFFFWTSDNIMWPLTSQALHNHYIENLAGPRSEGKCSYALPVKDGGVWDSVSLLVNPLKGTW